MTNAKKGISARQVTRDTNLPWTTVWITMHKIRNVVVNDEIKLLAGILEMNETYVGRGTSKECIIGIIERNGNVKATHVSDKTITSEYLQKIVKTTILIIQHL